MPQPTPYDRQNSFTTLASTNPSAPYTGADLDEEFNAVKVTLDELMANLALVQRDDGELGNQTVGPDQLAASLSIGINPPSAWATGVAYGLYDTVFDGTILYKALEAHTSGADFATDLAALKWELLAEFNTVAVADGEITTAKLADLAVTAAKIASDAVTTNKILDGTVTAAKIADGAVTSAKIGASAVATAKIQDAAITNAKLAAASLIAIGALTPATDKFAYFTDATTAALATITSAARNLLDDADAATMRTTLGLGTAAVLNTGTAAGTIPLLVTGGKLPAVDGSLLTGIVAGGLKNVQVFTSSGTYTPTSGATCAIAFITGGGGSGGVGNNGAGNRGGAGGAGATALKYLSSVSSLSVTVGAGGAAVSSNGATGNVGGQSALGTTTANGGTAGTPTTGGASQSTTSGATLTMPGGTGTDHPSSGVGSGAQRGGVSFWGSGGVGSGSDKNAPNYGAGGSGTENGTSGTGKAGVVVIFEF